MFQVCPYRRGGWTLLPLLVWYGKELSPWLWVAELFPWLWVAELFSGKTAIAGYTGGMFVTSSGALPSPVAG